MRSLTESTTASASNDTAFGSTTLGSPISETYTIANSGDAALTLGQVSIGGTNAADFTVTSQPAASVAAGSSTTFTVQFDPDGGGHRARPRSASAKTTPAPPAPSRSPSAA